MRITVLGGGNGSHAAAADLVLAGHEVVLWRRERAALAPVLAAGGIELLDAAGTRHVAFGATDNLADAVRGAALIVAPVPAFAQPDLARHLAPLLTDGQVVFLPPGTWGTLLLDQAVRAAGNKADIAYAEAGTLPWLCRLHPTQTGMRIAIRVRATRLPTGAHPARLAPAAFKVLEAAFPAIERLADGLDGALMNAGPIIHPPLITMNAGPLQHFERWDIHNEGTQPAIRHVTDALDAERIRLREALGYGAPHFPLADHYVTDGDEWMYGRRGHTQLVDSADWREHIDLATHRYMREDVACGLALLASLGAWAGVPMPVASGLLAVAGAAIGEDFSRTGRTAAAMGIAGMDRAALRRLLTEGTP